MCAEQRHTESCTDANDFNPFTPETARKLIESKEAKQIKNISRLNYKQLPQSPSTAAEGLMLIGKMNCLLLLTSHPLAPSSAAVEWSNFFFLRASCLLKLEKRHHLTCHLHPLHLLFYIIINYNKAIALFGTNFCVARSLARG